jgi:hypothetical protein
MLISAKYCLGLLFVGVTAVSGCSSAPSRANPPNPRVLPPAGTATPDVSELYRDIGLLAAPSPVAFVGKVSSFASAFPDTTLVLVSISIPNRALTFTREGDRYRAPYEVKLSLNRGEVEAETSTRWR